MIKVIEAESPAKPEYGSILRAHKFINRVEISASDIGGKKLIQVYDPKFTGLELLGISFNKLLLDVSSKWTGGLANYECPWTNNRYCWMFPLGILTDHPDEYINVDHPSPNPDWWCRVVGDGHFLDYIKDPTEWGGIVDAMMGHGYTLGSYPSDGHGQKVLGTMPLDNGDEILVACWIWFNK